MDEPLRDTVCRPQLSIGRIIRSPDRPAGTDKCQPD